MAPLYAGAPGRVLLAFAPVEVLDEVLAQNLLPSTSDGSAETQLRDRLADIVMTGVATSEGEFIDGSVAVAAPVFREDGIVGALGVIGPAFRCGSEWRARTAQLLQEAARVVNAGLAEEQSG